MKARHTLPIIFCVLYIALSIVLVLNSGAGHDWGTGAFFILSFPLGLVGLGLEVLFPNRGLMMLCPLFGLIQYGVIGYWLGRRSDDKERNAK
jgi:hypothetical protein